MVWVPMSYQSDPGYESRMDTVCLIVVTSGFLQYLQRPEQYLKWERDLLYTNSNYSVIIFRYEDNILNYWQLCFDTFHVRVFSSIT